MLATSPHIALFFEVPIILRVVGVNCQIYQIYDDKFRFTPTTLRIPAHPTPLSLSGCDVRLG